MKLIEADGKRILQAAGIAVPLGKLVGLETKTLEADWRYPVFIKAQVLQGRRGQRGLVKRATSTDEATRILTELRGAVRELPCVGFLIESEALHAAEWLVAFDIDPRIGVVRLTWSASGGVTVAAGDSRIIRDERDLDSLELPLAVLKVVREMYRCFTMNDALHLEINPLAIMEDGSCLALDAKVELDDAAAFRHPEWSEFTRFSQSGRKLTERELAYATLLEQAGHRGTLGRYVELDGDIAMILSGGGASLVAIDALLAAGGRPANYVEMSGNPDPDMVRQACEIVLSKPGIKAIWIAGSFANFTDIKATVSAVLSAITALGLRVPVVIRRDGPNAEEAKREAEEWGRAHGTSVRFDRADIDLDTSAQAVVQATL